VWQAERKDAEKQTGNGEQQEYSFSSLTENELSRSGEKGREYGSADLSPRSGGWPQNNFVAYRQNRRTGWQL
jgi:hypothetical protein